ncbi:hypothetical protein [Catelliglobosispora koreensis]|uniref:hypothetical protein n=1 Tax=Catelliglobosispora koreensis TaxID=129052 RepID=UPI00037B7383|nr:hypothetical protein [Catelliglobosispora koreensis]
MHTRTTLRSAAAALGLALVTLGLTAAPAQAKPGPTGHCVVALSDGKAMSCFGTFTEAIAFATNGRVADAPATTENLGASFDAKIEASNRAAAAGPTPQAVTLSIEHEGAPPPGAWSLTFTGATQCTASFGDVDYSYSLPSAYWDQISSYRTYFCYVDHHFWSTFGTPNTGFYFCSPAGAWCTIPAMQPGNIAGNNNTRSLRWT